MAALLDGVRFALPAIGSLAAGTATIAAALYGVIIAIEKVESRRSRSESSSR